MEQHPSKHGFHCGDRRYSLSPGVMPGCPTSAEQTLAALLSVREVLASMEVFGGIHVCRFTLTPKARSPHGRAPYPSALTAGFFTP
jgi:hypothetical protein